MDPRELSIRIGVLEAKNRDMRRLHGVTLCVVAVLVLLGQAAPAPKVIEAERFILKDSKGVAHAELSMEPGIGPSLTLKRKGGESALLLRSNGLLVPSLDGKGSIALGVESNGSSGIGIIDKSGVQRLDIRVLEGPSTPMIVLRGATGKAEAILTQSESTGALLGLGDPGSGSRVELKATGGVGTGVHVLDGKSRPSCFVGVAANASPGVSVWSSTGEGGAQLGIDGGGPVLSMVDSKDAARMELGITKEGAVRLVMLDPAAQNRLGLVVLPDGSPVLAAYDSAGKRIANWP